MNVLILLVACFASSSLAFRPHGETNILPAPPVNGPASFSSKASFYGMDGVQVQIPNATSYEWWYFDAVSADHSRAVVFQPHLQSREFGVRLVLRLNFAYGDGTFDEFTVPGDKLFVSTIGAGSAGLASDGSYSWIGAPDLAEYTINMDLPELGISGEITMQSVAPAHGPCGPAVAGATFDISLGLQWLNAIPDSVATVNLKLNGTKFAFQGAGYHDKNWIPFVFEANLNQWYWGHGRAGDLSVVWFDYLSKSNESVVSAYIARNNTIIHSACSGVTVRPFGLGVEYPIPLGSNATIEGYNISIDAGSVGEYKFTITATQQIVAPFLYNRWIGTLEGGLVGEESVSGPALWDQMGPIPEILPS